MAVTTGAGLEGIIATQSAICFIDGEAGILAYYGYDIHTLADNATFEEVIFLLWNGRLPNRTELEYLKKNLVQYRPIPEAVQDFLATVPGSAPMDVLRTAVSMLSLYDPLARDMSPESNSAKAHRLMAQTATIVTTFDRLRKNLPVVEGDPELGFAANFLYTLTGNKPDDVMERAFDVALTLHEDQTLELVAMDLHIAVNAVGEIVGKTATEDLLDMIFTQFCIGK